MRYKQYETDEKGWTHWMTPIMKGFKLRCCDCGLVHEFDFAVSNQKQIKFRAKRDNRATANTRRTKGR